MSTITSRIQNQIHTFSFFHIFVSVALPPKKNRENRENGHILHRKNVILFTKMTKIFGISAPKLVLKKAIFLLVRDMLLTSVLDIVCTRVVG